MVLTATVATAVAACAGCAALGGLAVGPVRLSPAACGLVLALAVGLSTVKPASAGLDPKWTRRFAIGSACALGALAFTGPQTWPVLAAFLPPYLLSVSLMWPQPAMLRLSLAASAVAFLVGGLPALGLAGATGAAAPGPVLVLLVAGAIALVALDLAATSGDTSMNPPRPALRRGAVRAAQALAVAVVVGLLAASFLKPQAQRPDSSGQGLGWTLPNLFGFGSGSGRDGGPTETITLDEPLDVGDGSDDPSDRPVLRVSASEPEVWRRGTYDRWDGRRWHRPAPPEPAQYLTPERRLSYVAEVAPGPGDRVRSRGALVRQEVEVLASFASVLPAAARPTVVYSARVVPFPDGTLHAFAVGKGSRYEVHSDRSQAAPDALRSAGPVAGEVPPDVAGPYLALDPRPSDRVAALAAELTAGRPTAYDEVLALQRWLSANTGVVADAAAVPVGQDPVDRFLFVDRAGPADRMATALAVLARSAGLPARLAVGYLPGERSLLGGDFVVRASHAHTWTEVWFPGHGWQAFDPSGRIAEAKRQDSLGARLGRLLARIWPLLALAVVVVVVWLVRRAVRRRRALRAQPWVTRYYARLGAAGARQGRPRQPHETPVEYTSALAAEVADQRLVAVGSLVTAAGWSGREPEPSDRDWAETVLAELVTLNPPKRGSSVTGSTGERPEAPQ